MLVDELGRHFRHSETRAVLEDLTSEYPDDPFIHASLASQLHYIENASTRALREVQHAILKAKAISRYVFYSLTLQADIATSVEDFALVEATLKEMMDFSMPAELIDIAPELSYLKRIPKGAIDEELRSRFIDFARDIRRTRGFEIAPGSTGR